MVDAYRLFHKHQSWLVSSYPITDKHIYLCKHRESMYEVV